MLKKSLLITQMLLLQSCSTMTADIVRDFSPDMTLKKDAPIVVKDFKGERGEEVRSLIEEALHQKGYKLLDRKNAFEEVLSKGKIQPASYVISGDVLNFSTGRTVKLQSAKCTSVENGQTVERYGESYDITYTGKVIANVRFSTPKTGQLILSKEVKGETSENRIDATCERTRSRQPDLNEMQEIAKKSFVYEFLKIVEPYKRRFEVTLFKVDEDIFPEVNLGHTLFQQNNLEGALEQYEKAIQRIDSVDAPNKVKGHIYYAYAVTLGYLGDPKFYSMFKKAFSYHIDSTYEDENRRLMDIQPKILKNLRG